MHIYIYNTETDKGTGKNSQLNSFNAFIRRAEGKISNITNFK